MEYTFIELSKIDQLRIIHLGLSFFGAVSIFLIWNKAQRITKLPSQDRGLLFISFAFLLWVAIDFYRLIGLMKPGEVSLIIKTFSVYNNAFFIAALPFFSYGFERIKEHFVAFRTPSTWTFYTLVGNVFIALLYSISWGDGNFLSIWIKYFDVCYSVLTLGLIGYAIIQYFLHRKNAGLSLISILLTIGLVIPQFAFLPWIKIVHFDTISVFILLTHAFLIMLFLIIAQSWLLEQELSLVKNEQEEWQKEKFHLEEQVAKFTYLNQQQREELATLKEQAVDSKTFQDKTERETKLHSLSEREKEVLQHIEKSYTEIGNVLFISRDTVISHKKNIEMKLGISGKENLADFAKTIGLIQ